MVDIGNCKVIKFLSENGVIFHLVHEQMAIVDTVVQVCLLIMRFEIVEFKGNFFRT
jgi:hypothetical protein